MPIEKYDRNKNKKYSRQILRLKNDNINKKCDLNKPLILQKYISKIMPKINKLL